MERNIVNSWTLFLALVAGLTNGYTAVGMNFLNGPEGSFSSAGYPALYPNNAAYTWVIHGGIRVQLTFHSFNLQSCSDCSCDYVEVRDGPTLISPLIGRYCGNQTVPITVTSSGEFLFVYFKTDSSVARTGFSANYTLSIKCPSIPRQIIGSRKNCPVTRRKLDRNCGELQKTFMDEQECLWTGKTGIFMRWEFEFLDEFRLKDCPDCSCEYIEFFDGRDSSSESLGRFCGSNKPEEVVTSGKYMSFKIKAGETSEIHLKYRGTYSGGTLAALILIPLAVGGGLLVAFCVCFLRTSKVTLKEEETVKMSNCDDEEVGPLNTAEDDHEVPT